ncbi:MAG: cytosine permease [Chloroflexi bacterium]|nr:MAG: cytosine permease [Chloroflexota bacterium]
MTQQGYPVAYLSPAAQEYVSVSWVQGAVAFLMVVAVGAWALSLVLRAIKGEEVQFPL